MNDEKNELDLMDLNGPGLNLDDFDPEVQDDKNRKGRSPVVRTAGSFLSGIKSSITTPRMTEKLVEDVLPKEYGNALLVKDKAISTFTSLGDDITKEIVPELNKIKRLSNRLIPRVEKFLPKSATEKLKKLTTVEEERSYGVESSAADARGAQTKELLDSIFSKQPSSEELLTKVYDDKKADLRTKANLTIQKANYEVLSKISAYQNNITANYQKHSLELKFKQYYLLKDLFKITQAGVKETTSTLADISTNTSLPDIQKIQKGEAWKEGLMGELFGGRGKAAGDVLNSFWGSAKTNLIDKVKEKLSAVTSMTSMATDEITNQLDTQEMMADATGEKADPLSSLATTGGGMGFDYLLGKALPHLQKFAEKNPEVMKGATAVGYAVDNSADIATSLSKRDWGNPILNSISEFVSDILPGGVSDRDVLEKHYRDAAREATIFDIATRKSIVEIIPGYLSRIHKGIMWLVQGEEPERIVYDSTKEEFTTIKEAAATAKKLLIPEYTKTNIENRLNEFYKHIDPENKLSEFDKSILSEKLIEEADKEVTGIFDPRKFYDESWIGEGVNEDTLKRIEEAVSGSLPLTAKGNLDITSNELREMTAAFKDITKVLPNLQGTLNDYRTIGETDVLRETGLIKKEESGAEKLDIENIIKEMLGELELKTIEVPQLQSIEPPKIDSNFKTIEIPQSQSTELPKVESDFKTLSDFQPQSIESLTEKLDVEKNKPIQSPPNIILKYPNMIEEDFEKPINEDIKNTKEILEAIYEKLNDCYDGKTEDKRLESIIEKQPDESVQLEVLDDIAAGTWATVDAITKGTMGSRDLTELKESISSIRGDFSVSKGAKSLLEGLGSFARSYGIGIEKVGGGVGAILRGSVEKVKELPETLKEVVQDIYVNGETEPRLLAIKMRKGAYVNSEDGSIVKNVKDIKGVVIDTTRAGEVVITKEDFDIGFYVKLAGGGIKAIPRRLFKLGKGFLGGYGSLLSSSYKLLKTGLSKIKDVAKDIMGVKDVYVAGEDEPRLMSLILRRGGYFSQTTGKPIFSLKEIDGNVMDSTGRVILAVSELKDTVDLTGKKIDLESFSDKVISGIKRGVFGIARVAGKLGFSSIKRGIKGTIEGGKDFLNIVSEEVRGKKIFEKKEETDKIEVVTKEQVNILKDIFDLLKERLPKPKKTISGSWQDQFAAKEEANEAQEKVEKTKGEEKGKSVSPTSNSNILGGLTRKARLAQMVGSGIVGAGSLAVSTVAGAATLATTIGSMVGGVASFAGSVAMGVGSILTAPIALKAMAVGGAVYGVYKGFKWVTSRFAPKPLEEFRYLQYGFRATPKSRLSVIRNFERSFMDRYALKGKTPTVNDLLEDYGGLFDLDLENIDHKNRWGQWLRSRFLPVLNAHYSAIKEMELSDFNAIDSEADEKKVEYLETVTPSSLSEAYEFTMSPFPYEEIEIDPSEIMTLKESLLESYGTKKDESEIETKDSLPTPSSEKIKEKETPTTPKSISDTAPDETTSVNPEINDLVISKEEKKELLWDETPVGIIETYRFLQYGINPNDFYQTSPIRALEKFCMMKFNGDIDQINETSPSSILKELIDFFPFTLEDSKEVHRWIHWYVKRFVPVYKSYMMFLDKESIGSLLELNRLDDLLGTKQSKYLILRTEMHDVGNSPYSILVNPFGGKVVSKIRDLIKEMRDYILSLVTDEEIKLPIPKLIDGAPEPTGYKTNDSDVDFIEDMKDDVSMITESADLPKVDPTTLGDLPKSDMEESGELKLIPPVDSKISSDFGIRRDPINSTIQNHKGVDFVATKGTPVKAAAKGKVVGMRTDEEYGNVVELKHDSGLITRYAHLSDFYEGVSKGDKVEAGDYVGKVGSTGRSKGDHLHFEVRKGMEEDAPAHDPVKYIKGSELLRFPSKEEKVDERLDKEVKDEEVGVGGPDDQIMDHQEMMGFDQVGINRETDLKQQRLRTLDLQREAEHNQHISMLSMIDETLKESLTVHYRATDYLEMIYRKIDLIKSNSAAEEITPVENEDSTITVNVPRTEEPVIPKLSLKRKKTNA